MAIVNLAQVERGLRAAFYSEYEKTEASYGPFCATIASKNRIEAYAFLASFPRIKEWFDSRQIERLQDFDYAVKNRKFEATVGMKVEDIEDNQADGYTITARQLGQDAADFYSDLIIEVLETGETALGFWKNEFFAADQKLGIETAWTNLHSGTGTTYDKLIADLTTVVPLIKSVKDPKNKPFFKRSHRMAVIAPPHLEIAFDQVLNKANFAGGESNQWFHKLDLLIFPQLSDADDWYIGVVDKIIKGMFLQVRLDPNFDRLGDKKSEEYSDHTFMYDEILFGTRIRANATFGWPHLFHKVKN